jgi:integrase
LWWYRCLARAGVVDKGATAGRRAHWARHTAIQRIVDKTGNIRLAQDVAGHSSIAVTEGYTRASASTQAEEMRKVLA